jgi:hypothetical protein
MQIMCVSNFGLTSATFDGTALRRVCDVVDDASISGCGLGAGAVSSSTHVAQSALMSGLFVTLLM